MENVSHSCPPKKGYHATVSERACNGGKFAGKTMYDDVFGGPPRFGVPTLSPRPEDYCEIFGGFHASRSASIPVLDLPMVDEEEVFFDVRSSEFDYSEVFGGFDGLDFATSYEELFRQSNGGGSRDRNVNGDSSGEAWIPAETESLSGDSNHSAKNQFSSNGDPYELIDSCMEFSISYHTVDKRSIGDLSKGITHIAKLNSPQYTYVVDEIMPLKRTENENPPVHVHDDGKGKHERNTIPHPAKRNAGQQIFTHNLESNGSHEKVGPLFDEMFITISEIGLKTQPSEVPPPSRPPPILDGKNKGYENSQTTASGGTVSSNSPPHFDVEIDKSSAAAASAAAMKEVMEKAQVKLRSAKEQMDRKREGVQNSMKPSSNHDAKDKKEKLSHVVDGSRHIKDKRVQGIDATEGSGMKPSIRQKQEVMENTQAVSNPLEKEKAFNMAKMPADEKHGKESLSLQGSDKIGVADEWQEATQFFELVRTEKSKMAFLEARNCSASVEKTKRIDHQLKAEKAATEALKQQEDSQCKEKALREDHELEKVLKNLKSAKETCERWATTGRSEAAKGAYRHKEHEKKVKLAHVVIKQEEYEVKPRPVRPLENGKKPSGVEESQTYEKQVNGQENTIEFEVQQAVKHKENKQLRKESSNSTENQRRSKVCQETKDGEKSQNEVFMSDENDIKLVQAHEQAENEKMMEGAHQQQGKEDKSLKQTCKLEENEKKEKEANERAEGEMIWRKALEQLENEKRLKQAVELEETQKERETCPKEETEKRSKQVLEQENNEKKQKTVYESEAIENRLEQDHYETDKTEKPLGVAFEVEDNSRTLKEARDREDEMQRKLALEQKEDEELMGVSKVHLQTEKDKIGEKIKVDEGAHQHVEGEDLIVSDEVCKLDSHAKPGLARSPNINCDEQEKAQNSVLVEDRGRMQTEYRDCETRSEATEEENLDRKSGFSGMDQDELEHPESQIRMEDATALYQQDENAQKTSEAGIGTRLRNAEKIISALRMDSDNEKEGRKPAYEWREIGKSINEAKAASNQEEDKDKFPTAVVKEFAETGRKIEAAQSSVREVKGDTLRTAQSVKISDNTERKKKIVGESLTFKEKETERMKRDIELEKDRLRIIEEEREREREREKDRMAVDRVTLEAWEPAYADVRERAKRAALERAIAEARQRTTAEARERLERASAEAREKSSSEARLRAERAAVERANSEAWEHAVEKAMAERATFEARERVERSVSDKFSTFSRNSGMGTCSLSSDLQNKQFKCSGSFNGSRYSSDYNGVGGESAQRSKARLERYQRTAARAAKALAEKNMRDLLAQREQAERNRLAETLDADVKRWSSGKEGNLRALLSTLQYILGPESGWQPIPLTEVITAAAVRKAYRKATLCVHPDKLQQRGASIQQKYICEKVFDLLKEAWSKFNSEER